MEKSEKLAKAKKKQKLLFLIADVLALLAIAFTLIVRFVDVQSIGPNESAVGLATINGAVHEALPFNELWYKLTKYSGYLMFLLPLYFAILFLVQLVGRKSLKKIDRELWLGTFYAFVVIATYFIFEHLLIINCRPVILDGSLEPSYPSSHTFFAITLCGASVLLVSRYLKVKHKAFVNTLIILLAVFNIVGRILSGVHWATDILGGILIGATLVTAFFAALKKPAKAKTE